MAERFWIDATYSTRTMFMSCRSTASKKTSLANFSADGKPLELSVISPAFRLLLRASVMIRQESDLFRPQSQEAGRDYCVIRTPVHPIPWTNGSMPLVLHLKLPRVYKMSLVTHLEEQLTDRQPRGLILQWPR